MVRTANDLRINDLWSCKSYAESIQTEFRETTIDGGITFNKDEGLNSLRILGHFPPVVRGTRRFTHSSQAALTFEAYGQRFLVRKDGSGLRLELGRVAQDLRPLISAPSTALLPNRN